MGTKNLLGLAGLVIAGATLSGCQSSRPQTNGPLMSGTTPMMGANAQQAGTNNMGLAQNQNQMRGWNERGAATTGMSTSTSGMVPTGGSTNHVTGTGTNSFSAPRSNTGANNTVDRSFGAPSGVGTSNTYPHGTSTSSFPAGTSTATPRASATTPGNDRVLTSPAAPSFPSSTGNSIGSAMQPSTSKPAASGSSITPPPVPPVGASPQFGTGTTALVRRSRRKAAREPLVVLTSSLG